MSKGTDVMTVSALVLLLVAGPLSAQGPYNKYELLFLQGCHAPGARTWGMGGAAVASVLDATAQHINPARLALLKGTGICCEIGHRGRIEWIESATGTSSLKPVWPVFCGLTIGLAPRLCLGLAYATPYRNWIDMGQGIMFSGNEAEDVHVYSKSTIENYSLSAAFGLSLRVSLGLTYVYHRAHSDDHYGDLFGQGTAAYTYSGAGHSLLFGMDVCPAGGVHVGATMSPPYTVEGSQRFRREEAKERFRDRFPAKLRIGGGFELRTGCLLAADFTWTFWGHIKNFNGERPYHNTLDLFHGIEWSLSRHLSLRGGYSTCADPWVDGLRLVDEDLNVLTFGISAGAGPCHGHLAVLDSHLLQSEDVETTRLLLGFTYHLRKGGTSP